MDDVPDDRGAAGRVHRLDPGPFVEPGAPRPLLPGRHLHRQRQSRLLDECWRGDRSSPTPAAPARPDVNVSTPNNNGTFFGGPSASASRAAPMPTASCRPASARSAVSPSTITLNKGTSPTATVSVNGGTLGPGVYSLSLRVTGTNSDGQPVTRLVPITVDDRDREHLERVRRHPRLHHIPDHVHRQQCGQWLRDLGRLHRHERSRVAPRSGGATRALELAGRARHQPEIGGNSTWRWSTRTPAIAVAGSSSSASSSPSPPAARRSTSSTRRSSRRVRPACRRGGGRRRGPDDPGAQDHRGRPMSIVREVPLDETNAQGSRPHRTRSSAASRRSPIMRARWSLTNLLASSAEGGQFSILGPDEVVAPRLARVAGDLDDGARRPRPSVGCSRRTRRSTCSSPRASTC